MLSTYKKCVENMETWSGSAPQLLGRVVVGSVFVLSGWGKLHSLPQVTEYFASIGIPWASVQAPMVACIELIGGVLLLAGLCTRLASLVLSATMVVAIITARRSDIHTIDDLFGFIEFLYIVLMFHLMVRGAGRWSLDHVFGERLKKHM